MENPFRVRLYNPSLHFYRLVLVSIIWKYEYLKVNKKKYIHIYSYGIFMMETIPYNETNKVQNRNMHISGKDRCRSSVSDVCSGANRSRSSIDACYQRTLCCIYVPIKQCSTHCKVYGLPCLKIP